MEQGKALYELGRYKEARDAYKHAIQLNISIAQTYSDQGKALVEKGKALYDLGQYEEACNIFEQAILFYPTNARAYPYQGKAFYKLCQYKKALDPFNKTFF